MYFVFASIYKELGKLNVKILSVITNGLFPKNETCMKDTTDSFETNLFEQCFTDKPHDE